MNIKRIVVVLGAVTCLCLACDQGGDGGGEGGGAGPGADVAEGGGDAAPGEDVTGGGQGSPEVPGMACSGAGGEPLSLDVEHEIRWGQYTDSFLGTTASYNVQLLPIVQGGSDPVGLTWEVEGKEYGLQIYEILDFWYAPYGEAFGNRGLATDGEHLYVMEVKKDSILKYQASGDLVNTLSIKGASSEYWSADDLTFDGQDLWINVHSISHERSELYRVSTSGTVLDEVPLSFNARSCITWDGESLWTADEEGLVRISEAGDIAERVTIPGYEGSYYISAMAWTGTEFLVLEGGDIFTVSRDGVPGERFQAPGDCSGDGLAPWNDLVWYSDQCSGLIAGTSPTKRGTRKLVAGFRDFDFDDQSTVSVTVQAEDCEGNTEEKTLTFTQSQLKAGSKFSGGGGGGGDHCECHCTCQYCSSDSTCDGAGCGSCLEICIDVCTGNPDCGGYVTHSGECW